MKNRVKLERDILDHFYILSVEDYILTKLGVNMDRGVLKNKYSIQIYPGKYNPSLLTMIVYQRVELRVYYSISDVPEAKLSDTPSSSR